MENDHPIWLARAISLLETSLEPPIHELNELDWKSSLTPNKQRLTEHLSAMSNHSGGGFLVFGVKNCGELEGIQADEIEKVVNQVTNLGRDGLEPQVAIEHAVIRLRDIPLLILHIPESSVKPVHLRGKTIEKCWIRSGGSTRTASRQEIGNLMLQSRTPHWEELPISVQKTDDEILESLDYVTIFKLLERRVPIEKEEILHWMEEELFIGSRASGRARVTNLGAIAAAKQLKEFPDLDRKAVRVIEYSGIDKTSPSRPKEGAMGYAISFENLIEYVTGRLPQSEVIAKALRETHSVYPEIALRELIANALIHQDFSVRGAGPLVEIYSNRIEISNPGGLLPSKVVDRIIGSQPESRNEKLARSFRRYRICEEQGSGLIKAGNHVELFGLPPIRFELLPNAFKVTLFAPRSYSQMTNQERLDACYQHAVLRFYSNSGMTNTTLRERLKMPEKQRSMVSTLLQQALDIGRIKPTDPLNKSRKFAEYVPYWA